MNLLYGYTTITCSNRHVGVDFSNNEVGAINEILVQADRDPQTDRAIRLWRRDLGDHHVRLHRAILVHQSCDLAKTHRREVDLLLFEELADARCRLPGHITKVCTEPPTQKCIVAKC